MFTTVTTDNLIDLASGSVVCLAPPAHREFERELERVLDRDVDREVGREVDVAVDWTGAREHYERDRDREEPPGSEPVNRRAARCGDGNGTLTHLFFSDDLLDIARAKAICRKCTQADVCLTGALERAEPWGVWGGELLTNGEIVVNKRPRGRPPKHPRPELVVDEIPLALLLGNRAPGRVRIA